MGYIKEISVRELIGFTMRHGSLDGYGASFARMRQGSAVHRYIQSLGGENYSAEVPLSASLDLDEITFNLSGRADGIIINGEDFIVDEIKTISRSPSSVHPEDYPEYEAQADLYAYMLAIDKGLSRVGVRLTFVKADTLEVMSYDAVRTVDRLSERVYKLLRKYYRFALLECEGRENFVSTAHKLRFPHKGYREGQEDIIIDTFKAIRKKKRLFVEAPTGIGKTLSICYGAIKAVGEGSGRRIFYLTPKSTVGEAPTAAFDMMIKKGLAARRIFITAKEKCCLCRESVKTCSSVTCPYSDGHYDRVGDALFELLSGDGDITAERITAVATAHRVCPYELTLDALEYCDIIICDCNYLFDPRVYLRRFFEETNCDREGSIVLIDEAHDLIDRAREMYGAQLNSNEFKRLLSAIPENDLILYSPLRHMYEALASLARECTENEYYDGENTCGTLLREVPFEGISETAKEFFAAAMQWLRVNGEGASQVVLGKRTLDTAVREAAFNAKRYADGLRLADECFMHLAERRGERVKLRLICIDPSKLLNIRMGRVRSAVLFSATLKPMDYFCDLLAGKDAKKLCVPSPFDKDNLFCGVMNKISMRYSDRERTLADVIEIIDITVNSRFGNYMVFLPSYEMLKQVAGAYRRYDPEADIRIQKPDMTENDRKTFLANFTEDSAVIGFAVLGGMFAESIDLAGEKLIGAVIVGTGLARLNIESNIIADYFARTRESGFEYAYLYPAMNKVLQAIGRAIRSEEDRGVCILIDDRYATPPYSKLLCDHIKGIRLIGNLPSLNAVLEEFWESEEDLY